MEGVRALGLTNEKNIQFYLPRIFVDEKIKLRIRMNAFQQFVQLGFNSNLSNWIYFVRLLKFIQSKRGF